MTVQGYRDGWYVRPSDVLWPVESMHESMLRAEATCRCLSSVMKGTGFIIKVKSSTYSYASFIRVCGVVSPFVFEYPLVLSILCVRSRSSSRSQRWGPGLQMMSLRRAVPVVGSASGLRTRA